jgi:hypothetical protein
MPSIVRITKDERLELIRSYLVEAEENGETERALALLEKACPGWDGLRFEEVNAMTEGTDEEGAA